MNYKIEMVLKPDCNGRNHIKRDLQWTEHSANAQNPSDIYIERAGDYQMYSFEEGQRSYVFQL